jgi:hypothetical protein
VRPRKTVLAAIATGVALTLAACGQPPSRVSPAAQSGGESGADGPGITKSEAQRMDVVTNWADGYCTAESQIVQTLSTMPVVDPSSQARAFTTSSALLGSLIGGIDQTVRNLQALPPSPVAGGDTVRTNAIATYTGIRDRTAAAKQRLDTTGPNSSESKDALGDASAPLNEVSKVNLLAGFDSVPELAGAVERAPTCSQLTAHGGPAPSLSTGGAPRG